MQFVCFTNRFHFARQFPLELRVPNKLTANTIEKAERGEELETFDSLESLFESWSDE